MTFSKKIKTFNNMIFYFFCLFVLKKEIYLVFIAWKLQSRL